MDNKFINVLRTPLNGTPSGSCIRLTICAVHMCELQTMNGEKRSHIYTYRDTDPKSDTYKKYYVIFRYDALRYDSNHARPDLVAHSIRHDEFMRFIRELPRIVICYQGGHINKKKNTWDEFDEPYVEDIPAAAAKLIQPMHLSEEIKEHFGNVDYDPFAPKDSTK